MLVRTPGLSAVAILTIALGVGLTTHTFSVVYGAAIRGLDLDGGGVLVSISQDIPSEETRGGGIPILDLVDFLHGLNRNFKCIDKAVIHIEITNCHCQLDDLCIIVAFMNNAENIISLPCCIKGDVFRPQEGCFFSRAEEGRAHIIIGADNPDLIFCNACRLTKRRVMRQSIRAAIQMTGFDDGHFFDLTAEHAAAAG